MEFKIDLPFKVGDIVFVIRYYYNESWGRKPRIVEAEVQKIKCDKKGWCIIADNTRSKLDKCGESWFLTKAEAEEKLKKLLKE